MQARITRYKMKPDATDAFRELLLALKDEIMALPGMQQCVTVMHADGSGYVIALTDARGGSPESVDRVRAIWHKFHDHIEEIPTPEIFEVVGNWSREGG
jgi:hypothetical protein